ncbi:hypothetical protein GCM10012275_34090 [Longimycelium tulufanense]|uniref:Uncharacterized protein n=1 Tax=Longimycelium tulufanense TaxID=907463 RepID=A0A8J3C9C9_9PSEU|nr:DUF6412 domain-containing protein [Longimycelium tulufanense]GGM60104.1 hypothetical protein GCM10012275_34090 [Longimycelium tulufanense]
MRPFNGFGTMLVVAVPGLYTGAVEALGNPANLVALASFLVAGLVVLAVCQGWVVRLGASPVPARVRAAAMRARSRRAAFLRQRDPGAPGRSRPALPR